MIKLVAVNKSYKTGGVLQPVLHAINLEIKAGEFVAIMGESGSGKSTLVNIIGFLDKNFTSEYFFEGQPIHKLSNKQLAQMRNRSVGFVFQNFKLIETLTVEENVLLPLLYAGETRKVAKPLVQAALAKVGLAGMGAKKPLNLSGGQQQRVAIARAIVTNPSFLIADEPTGALDSKTSKEIMDLFLALKRELGTTVVMVTHDEALGKLADRVVRILDGRIIADSANSTTSTPANRPSEDAGRVADLNDAPINHFEKGGDLNEID